MQLRREELNEHQTAMYSVLTLGSIKNDSEKIPIKKDQFPLVSKIIQKRIESMDLPINFTDVAIVAADILAKGNPGYGILILIECLNKFEGETITIKHLSQNLYSNGFYDEESCEWIIDNQVKTRKMKWSEIY